MSAGSAAPLLEVSELHVRYALAGPAKARLLRLESRFLDAVLDVSFTIRAGAAFGLVGESGSGKSTLGRALMRMVPVESGEVRFAGHDVLRIAGQSLARYRRDVAMMFQDPVGSLSPRRNVRSLLEEPFRVHGVAPGDPGAEVERLLAMVGLPADFGGRYPHQLSGGQARRVGVARALALNPKLVIADEPTAGLDVSVQGEILNLLRRLQRELGLTLLIITHNLSVVRLICDEIAVMYMGRFVERGPTAALFGHPAHPYTHGLISAQPRPDPGRRRETVELIGETPSLARRPQGCEFHTRCAWAEETCRHVRPIQSTWSGRVVRCHFPLPATGAT